MYNEGVFGERHRIRAVGDDLAGAPDDEVDFLGVGVVVQGTGLAGFEDGQASGQERAAQPVAVDHLEHLAAEAGIVEAEPERVVNAERVDHVDHHGRLSLEDPLVDVPDVPVARRGYRFVDHRHVQHGGSAPPDGRLQGGGQIPRRRDLVTVGAAGPPEGGEVRAVGIALGSRNSQP
jgi:hypothetical protein